MEIKTKYRRKKIKNHVKYWQHLKQKSASAKKFFKI